MSNILEIDSVRKAFWTNQVLTDVYLKCEPGDIIGLLGRNGSGKTTLLKIIFGTLYTDYKHIRINDLALNQPYKTKKLVSFLNQDNFLPKNLTIRQIVNLYSAHLDSGNFLQDTVLSKVLDTKISVLSGGESRYLEVKLIINLDSQFVLLDEPFNGISPLHIELIKKMILDKSSKKGIVLTDHDYRNVLDIANKYFLLFDGGIKKIKTREDLIVWGYIPDK
jgi:lipopolysaccharide export system ATP-binding protein